MPRWPVCVTVRRTHLSHAKHVSNLFELVLCSCFGCWCEPCLYGDTASRVDDTNSCAAHCCIYYLLSMVCACACELLNEGAVISCSWSSQADLVRPLWVCLDNLHAGAQRNRSLLPASKTSQLLP